MSSQTTSGFLSAFSLRTAAMILMLIDHIGLVFYPDIIELRYIGRLAFPIFAFLIVEGYFHTRELKKYLIRLLGLAIIADLPFHFMSHQNWEYHPFQNVIWTFLISLVAMVIIGKIRQKPALPVWLPISFLITGLGCWLAVLADSDYDSLGVLMVLGFYYFRGQSWPHKLGQFLTMFLTNVVLASIEWFQKSPYILEDWDLYWKVYGKQIIPTQIWGLCALALIWLYNGQAGHRSRPAQTASYLFYPVHMLLIGFGKIMGG